MNRFGVAGLALCVACAFGESSAGIDPELQRRCQQVVDEVVASGEQGAVQFCAYRDGACIVDVWAGSMTTNPGAARIDGSTLFPIYSTEKPVLATAVHRAVERGLMAYDKPLSTWWPEFVGDGKENLTLGLTLGYRSGMPGRRDPKIFRTVEEQCDWRKICEWAARVKPELPPGTVQRYMPASYGWYLGHPLEVAYGKPLKETLDELVLRPAGIEDDFFFSAGDAEIPRIVTVYGSPKFEGMNDNRRRRMCLPSSYGVANARSIAKFYNRLCGFDGQAPLVRKETLDAALVACRHESDPLPQDLDTKWQMVFGMGYGLWGERADLSRVFGHGGFGGSEGLCDRRQRLTVGFTCNFCQNVCPVRARLYALVGMKWRYGKDAEADIQNIQIQSSGSSCDTSSTVRVEAPFGRLEFTLPAIPARDFPITDFGAEPGEKCTDAIARAMTACHAAGGGRVVVPKGTWLTGKVHFKSDCELHLAKGAILEFSDEPEDYLPVVQTSWEGVECLNYSPLLYAYDVTNVALTGPGEIRARMGTWRGWFGRSAAHMQATESLYHWCSTNAPMAVRDLTAIRDSHMRPHFIQMNRAKNVRLEGFSIRDSPFWTIHLYHSENCVVRGLRGVCRGNNNDGVDVEMTRNVLIEDCDLDQGDDGIVLKAGRNQDAWRLARPTENVVVRRCNLHMSHSLLGIGSELSGGIRNVWMTDCHVECTGSLLKIKTNRRRGGFVENVWVDNVTCADNIKGAVFTVQTDTIYQWARFPDYEIRYTAISNVNVRNATAGTCDWIVNLKGDAHLPPKDLTVDGLSVRFARKGERQVTDCENVTIRNLRITHPEEAALEALRVPATVRLENAALGSAYFIQLSNALPEVTHLHKTEQFPDKEGGEYHVRLFPGEYEVRWPCKDGRERIGRLTVRPSGESTLESVGAAGPYAPTWESLDARPVPQWWRDAKFGIFVHWGPYAVPAYAPTDAKSIYTCYAEWYHGRLIGKNKAFLDHHARHYGTAPYGNFAAAFTAENFKADEWAELFRKAGARYAVLTSKHHDGYALWPSAVTPYYNSVAIGSGRDLCGEFTAAMKRAGLRSGFYYSLLEYANPLYPKKRDGRNDAASLPMKEWAARMNLPQMKELVERYKADIIWPDGEWDWSDEDHRSLEFLSWLYNDSGVRETVAVNDRWGRGCRGRHGGYYTTEYGTVDEGVALTNAYVHPWEECRGIGNSFGYNRYETPDQYMSREKCIETLVSTVSRGGNLLLNVGPTADGRIPAIMQDRLLAIGRWLSTNGEAIYASRRSSVRAAEERVYTTEAGGAVYAIDCRKTRTPFHLKGIGKVKAVELLGDDSAVSHSAADGVLEVTPPVPTNVDFASESIWCYKVVR